MRFSLRRLLVGSPMETDRAIHERLPKRTALAVFASDALSSTAYATQEIALALLLSVSFAAAPGALAGQNVLPLVWPIGLSIAVVLWIVVTSYRQTIHAYPGGGGAYLVARDNLGQTPGLVAAAALLIDYVLTVAVSIAAGVAALTSALPELRGHPVELGVAFVFLVALLNLRGARESARFFALPTYGFVLAMLVLIGAGLWRYFSGVGFATYEPLSNQLEGGIINEAAVGLGALILLRAFASGCTALTGVEAISDGVSAFKKPEARNASTTLLAMAVILTVIFLGVTFLTWVSGAQPILALEPGTNRVAFEHDHLAEPTETLLSVLARLTFDGTTLAPFYFVIQGATALILILAANTAFADFPRLASILARDRFFPRQFANLGDRLVYSNGILALSACSAFLIWVFRGSTTQLIALYAVGVFTSFTLSQSGMVMHWLRVRKGWWMVKLAVNAAGATVTLIVALVIAATKFVSGAWMVTVAVPLLVYMLRSINTHYRSVSRQLSMEGYRPRQGGRTHVLVLVPDVHRGVIPALQLARSISGEARAIHVAIDPSREKRVRQRFTLYGRGMPLTVLPSPFRSLPEPIVAFIQKLRAGDNDSTVIVVIPEFEPHGWWPKLLHGHAGLALAVRLHFLPGVVVVNVPYHIRAIVDVRGESGHEKIIESPADASVNLQNASSPGASTGPAISSPADAIQGSGAARRDAQPPELSSMTTHSPPKPDGADAASDADADVLSAPHVSSTPERGEPR